MPKNRHNYYYKFSYAFSYDFSYDCSEAAANGITLTLADANGTTLTASAWAQHEDGFKAPNKRKVITFSDEKDGLVAHKNTVYKKINHESKQYVVELALAEITSGGGFEAYAAVVADNVAHMRDTVLEIQNKARKEGHITLGLGCAAHTSDLLAVQDIQMIN